MSNREADDNIGEEADGDGLVSRLRKFVDGDDDNKVPEVESSSPPKDVPSAWDPPANRTVPPGGSAAAGSASNEPAWPPPPPDAGTSTPPIPGASAPPPLGGPPIPPPSASRSQPPAATGREAIGGIAAGAAGIGGAAAASKRSLSEASSSTAAMAAESAKSELPPPPPSARAMPIAPNGPDDHFGPPEPGAVTSPARERDPWPEKPGDATAATPEVDAASGKRDLLIGLGLIALAGLVAGGVILLNWNRDKDITPIAGGTTTTIDADDAVAALATTTTQAPAPTTTSTTTPPIPTTTIPAMAAVANLAQGESTSIAFDNGSANVSLGAALLLDDLAAEVNASDRHVLVQGFAAPGEAGDEQAAVILSLARANGIKSALVDRGVDPSRMTLFGCGSAKHPGSDGTSTSEVLMQFAPAL